MSSIACRFDNSRVMRAIICFLIFLAAFFTRIYYIEQKSGFHIDEVMTVMISNYSPFWHDEDSLNKKTITGKEVKDSMLRGSGSIKDAFLDVKKLYINNRDRPHTNLYYSCFRLWFAGISTTDRDEIIKLGCYLNIFFFIFSFLFFYKIARIFFQKDYLVYLSLIVAFFNTGTISNTLFLRPYELQQTLIIIFTYIFIKYFYGKKQPIKLIFAATFDFLSGYYVSIYVLMAFLVLAVKYKDDRKILFMYFLFALALGGVLYHQFFVGFTCGRAGESFKKLSPQFFFDNLMVSLPVFAKIIKNFIFYPESIILLVISTFFSIKNLKKLELPVIIFSICVLWSAGNIFLAPFKDLRYIVASFPLMSLIIPYVVSKNYKEFFKYLFTTIFSGIFVLGAFKKNVENLYSYQKDLPKIMNSKLPSIVFFKDKNTFFAIYSLIPFFLDQKIYTFSNSNEDVESFLKKYDNVFIIYERGIFTPPRDRKTKILLDTEVVIAECSKNNVENF